MSNHPLGTLSMVWIGAFQGQLSVDEKEGESLDALGLKQCFDFGVLNKGHGLLGEVKPLNNHSVLLQLVKETRYLWQDGIDVRSADSGGATHGRIVHLELFHKLGNLLGRDVLLISCVIQMRWRGSAGTGTLCLTGRADQVDASEEVGEAGAGDLVVNIEAALLADKKPCLLHDRQML